MKSKTLVALLIVGFARLSQAADFGSVISEIGKCHRVVVLSSPDSGKMLAICPGLQARVMTSTAQGRKGRSFGWVNIGHIRSGKITPHINAWGGEDRIWFGPEGGQYSLFFKKGDPFEFAYWQVPLVMDTEPFEVQRVGSKEATFYKKFKIQNYSGFEFDAAV